MKIVIAPDSFKGSVSSTEAAHRVRAGLQQVDPSIEAVEIPVADGGEGTVDALIAITAGELVHRAVEDPIGRRIEAAYGWIPGRGIAVVETAAASGLPLLAAGELDPERASTFGTGELARDALDRGASELVIGLGGSATVDGGVGFFQSLGVRFLDGGGQPIARAGGRLDQIAAIDPSGLDPRLKAVRVVIASDVTNPLLGPDGAVAVFGPQKGVRAEEIDAFERGMAHYAGLVRAATGRDVAEHPGSGAAGGFGCSLLAFLDAELRSGFELVAELGELERHIRGADLVITGEGRIDRQTLFGKVPVGIARIAKRHGVPVVAFGGKIDVSLEGARREGLSLVWPIVDAPMTLEQAMKDGPRLMQAAAERLMQAMRLAAVPR